MTQFIDAHHKTFLDINDLSAPVANTFSLLLTSFQVCYALTYTKVKLTKQYFGQFYSPVLNEGETTQEAI